MIRVNLQNDKYKLSKELKDPNLPAEVREVMETAIKEIDMQLESGEHTGIAKYWYKIKEYGFGGITDDDLWGWDYKKEVVIGKNAQSDAETAKNRLEARGYTVEVKKIPDLDNVYHVYAEKRLPQRAEHGIEIPGDIKRECNYQYFIDLNERGSFRAHVEDNYGIEVYTILAGHELEEGETSIFEDGYMSDINDVSGLAEFLKNLNIIGPNDTIVGQYSKEYNKGGIASHPAENMRIFSYQTSNFDICPEAKEMFKSILDHPHSEDVKHFIVSVAKDFDRFLGIVKQEREKDSIGESEMINATSYLMKAMYLLYPVLTKMIGNEDPTRFYPHFAGPYMAELAGYHQKKRKGGQIKTIIKHVPASQSKVLREQKNKDKTNPLPPKKEKGGEIKFNDKVKAISKSLVGRKVPKKYQKQYGKTYDAAEANAAAKRIAGSIERDRKSKKKRKPIKKLFGGLINVESVDNLSAHSGDAWFPN